MAGRSRRLYPVEQRVAVAIEANLDYFLRVATRRSLVPELSAGAGEVVSLAGLDGPLDGLGTRVGEHQDLTRVHVLSDDGNETPLVIADLFRSTHRTGIPACASRSLTSAMLYSPK